MSLDPARTTMVAGTTANVAIARVARALDGRYRIVRELGAGGMATVYLAHDVRHDREVAVKVLRPELGAVLGAERFLAEIRITARLDHPHILTLIDSGENDGLLWYVLPFVRGESLAARLSREKQLGVDEALGLTRQVAGALDYAHQQGVVHRDIKPENILLHEGEAMLADFGIALAVAEAGGDRLTQTGLSLGTPRYMSPEQATGRPVDARSDVYSLGAVLYELLAGEPPHTGASMQALLAKLLTEPPTPLRTLRSTVPDSVDAAVMRALSKAPADRWPTVGAFARALTLDGTGSEAVTVPSGTPRQWARKAVLAVAVVAVVLAVLLTLRPWRSDQIPAVSAAMPSRMAIAVLPFQNLSAAESNAYLASGLHDELLTQLAKVAALTVMGRTSVSSYAGTTKSPSEIARELSVGSIVEGTVQVIGTRLQVNIKLLAADTGRLLWTEQYPRTLDDVFAIQRDVAQKVVSALGAALAAGERDAMGSVPTAHAEAYRLYLQGNAYRSSSLSQDVVAMQRLYERAIALDPGFALAYAGLSHAHGTMFWFKHDPSPERMALQFAAAETALRLAPDAPEAHWAMGMAHYWGHRDYQRALNEMTIALRGLPNDAALVSQTAYVHRRLGHWKEVFSTFERARILDPRHDRVLYDLGGLSFEVTRRYAEAVRAYDEALSVAPYRRRPALAKAWTYARWRGELDELRSTLAGLSPDVDLGDASLHLERAMLLLWERRADQLIEIEAAELVPRGVMSDQVAYVPASLFAGWAYRLRGDAPSARKAFSAALALLEAVPASLRDDRVHGSRGLALAGLERHAEALSEARWLKESVVYREDAYGGPRLAEARAMILAQAGQPEAALDEIERLLSGPSLLTAHTLRLDPRWDPIRGHPRFNALLVKYADPAAITR